MAVLRGEKAALRATRSARPSPFIRRSWPPAERRGREMPAGAAFAVPRASGQIAMRPRHDDLPKAQEPQGDAAATPRQHHLSRAALRRGALPLARHHLFADAPRVDADARPLADR